MYTHTQKGPIQPTDVCSIYGDLKKIFFCRKCYVQTSLVTEEKQKQ